MRWTNLHRVNKNSYGCDCNSESRQNIKSMLKAHSHFNTHTHTGLVVVPKATQVAPTSAFKSRSSLLLSFHKSSTTNLILCVSYLFCEEKAIKIKISVWVQPLLVVVFFYYSTSCWISVSVFVVQHLTFLKSWFLEKTFFFTLDISYCCHLYQLLPKLKTLIYCWV